MALIGSVPDQEEEETGSGMFSCIMNVFRALRKPLLKKEDDSSWYIPFESIRELNFVGSGAQGTVFKGRLNGEMVAVKKVRDHTEADVKFLRKLNHESIVRFRGVCVDSPYHCVVMDYHEMGSLFDYLHSDAPLLPARLMSWAKNICLGMAYLHCHNIIHRDLKSPNVLITNDLSVKVSDFGTSREWENESTVMSFTGTVSWMAPEVIRHEPCSAKVDVWSFGVVLWELMTREIPFHTLESHAILWGVGTDSLALPIPIGFPNTIQLVMCQCWQRMPRNRPSFKVLAAYLDMATPDIAATPTHVFAAKQKDWGVDVCDAMERIYFKSERDWNHAKNAPSRSTVKRVHEVYDQQINRANEMFMEVCTLRLQLEQRERAVDERENQLNNCRCGQRKPLKKKRRSSSSSECRAAVTQQPRRQRPAAQLYVSLNDAEKPKTSTVALQGRFCSDESVLNNNVCRWKPKAGKALRKKETVVEVFEENGNVEIDFATPLIPALDNAIPDVARV